MLQINKLSKTYGSQKVLNEISFSVSQGEILALLGPNGAGKSTTMKSITGSISYEGSILVNNHEVKDFPQKIKKMIGYLPEHNPLYVDMYVKEYLEYVGKIYGVKSIADRIDEIINLTGLTKEQHKKIQMLSKGYRQRVGLAQALIHDPKILILDEPTTGLDPNQLVEIRTVIKEIAKQKTIILSTHIMQEVEALADRLIIIRDGNIVANKNIKDLSNETVEEFFLRHTRKSE
ncbi:MAG: ATP-binding cassette domain-containing protein [Paludibacteraceae bacterium]|nr:ATP-binding cassette domain-containing protein [Paludibacteraceae bacterium]MBQ5779436.1 ATP-binding cassette domain-containing protein [Paludibacteraceae bacterium]